MPPILPRDSVETKEGLFFAVVAQGVEQQRLLTVLRYVRVGDEIRKLSTDAATRFLASSHPQYLYHSTLRDVALHGVPLANVHRHHSARERIKQILNSGNNSVPEEKTTWIVGRLVQAGIPVSNIGITGSLLIGTHHAQSDIDLVFYDRSHFHLARDVLRQATVAGDLQPLDESAWQAAFARRGCCLSFDEFLWHERRKHNKFVFRGTKADVSLVNPNAAPATPPWKKAAKIDIRARILDDWQAFDYPARWRIDHDEIKEIVSFTNTYTGQAFSDEFIAARGWKETSRTGASRLLVGTSREAHDEYIKVVR